MGNWLNWPYWRRLWVARFTLLGQCQRARSSNAKGQDLPTLILEALLVASVRAKFVGVASRLIFIHLGEIRTHSSKKDMVQFVDFFRLLWLVTSCNLSLGLVSHRFSCSRNLHCFGAFLWVNVSRNFLAPEKIESDRRERTEKLNLVNAHPPLGHHPPIGTLKELWFFQTATGHLPFLLRSSHILAAKTWSSPPARMHHWGHGRWWTRPSRRRLMAKKGQVITIKPSPNGTCGPWASHNISHMDPYGFYTYVIIVDYHHYCWKCMYGISKLP